MLKPQEKMRCLFAQPVEREPQLSAFERDKWWGERAANRGELYGSHVGHRALNGHGVLPRGQKGSDVTPEEAQGLAEGLAQGHDGACMHSFQLFMDQTWFRLESGSYLCAPKSKPK